jgi:succinate dehydrogenase hydrophobic anchor subunit
MDWWILEVMTTVLLVALALWLGPFIKRFGKSYAADVFRSNPRTGKSFILLTDIAYYLIFLSYILFTVTYEPRSGWAETVNAKQLQAETARVAGILLIIGLLHGINLLALPVMGRLLTLNRRLDDDTVVPPTGPSA